MPGRTARIYAAEREYDDGDYGTGALIRPVQKSPITELIESTLALNNAAEMDLLMERLDAKYKDFDTNDKILAALHVAAGAGKRDVVHFLVEHGAAVNAEDRLGFTALQRAAKCASIEVMHILLEFGADVNISKRYPPLVAAARSGKMEAVKLLVENGANVNAEEFFGGTALLAAIESADLDMVNYLIKNDADANIESGFFMNQRTALHIAVSANKVDVVTLLIKHGTSVNTSDKDDLTPLHTAAQNGNAELIRLLVENGADVNALSKDGKAPLYFACDRIDVVQVLVEIGAAVNAPKNKLSTALHAAAGFGNVDVMKYLLKNGAAVNAQDQSGWTALFHAKNVEMITFLLENGAEVGTPADSGETLLQRAVSDNKLEVIKLLLANGASVNLKSPNGSSALAIAAQKGLLEVVQLMVESSRVYTENAVSNERDALHAAASEGHFEVVKYLVESKAVIGVDGDDGHTALFAAATNGHFDIVAFLLNHGATYRGETRDSWTIWSLAEFHNQQEKIRSQLEATCTVSHPNWLIPPDTIRIGPDASTFGSKRSITPSFSGSTVSSNVKVGTWLGAWVGIHTVRVSSNKRRETFRREVGVWQKLNHPHIIKLYGAYHIDQPYFVFEHVGHTDLWTYLRDEGHKNETWKKLHEVALGLQYLHERGIVHGDLGTGTIMIGEDGKAKLTGFSFSGVRDISFADDIFDLGVYIYEVVTGVTYNVNMPLEVEAAYYVTNDAFPSEDHLTQSQRDLVIGMSGSYVKEQLTLPDVIRQLDAFVSQEADKNNEETSKQCLNVSEYLIPEIVRTIPEVLKRIRSLCHKPTASDHKINFHIYKRLFDLYNQLAQTDCVPQQSLIDSYCSLLLRVCDSLKASASTSKMVRIVASRQRADNNFSYHKQIDRLMERLSILKTNSIHDWESTWTEHRQQQIESFATLLENPTELFQDLDDEQARVEALVCLRFELSKHRLSYAAIPEQVLLNATKEIVSTPGVSATDWFIPPYEVKFDEFDSFSSGAFGSVHFGKWMGSDVVIKKVFTDDKHHRKIFEREVNIWFKLFHPHVVQLFGACNVGKPFFVCEFAANGQLDDYLQKEERKNEAWQKLYEAALGLQYLHHCKIIHGDLKCNNILVGTDGLAKLTDFGLSIESETNDEYSNEPAGALRWKAPEILMGKKPTFASDVFGFGMCILEGVSGECPWGNVLPDSAVQYHVKRGKLPQKPDCFRDDQWDLVQKMCRFDPQDRIELVDAVVKLKAFAKEIQDISS